MPTILDHEINGNKSKAALPLSDVIETINEALTFKAQVEYGRLGFMAGSITAACPTANPRPSTRKPITLCAINLAFPAICASTLKVKGDLDLDVDANETIVDLAFRYRGGAIQKPRMEKGSAIHRPGGRTHHRCQHPHQLDAGGKPHSAWKDDAQQGIHRELPKSSGESYGCTWVQPLIGVFGTYAISEDWQAFAYLDAGGFGLVEQDLVGPPRQACLCPGNSAQISLSYKYFGLDYAGGWQLLQRGSKRREPRPALAVCPIPPRPRQPGAQAVGHRWPFGATGNGSFNESAPALGMVKAKKRGLPGAAVHR